MLSTEYPSTSLAILTWLPLIDVKKKFEILRERMEKELEDGRNRDARSKKVDEVKAMGKKQSLATNRLAEYKFFWGSLALINSALIYSHTR